MNEHDPFEAAAHCPNCGAEYRAGFETCADCGHSLVPGPAPAAEDDGTRDEGWAVETATDALGDALRDPDLGRAVEPLPLCRVSEEHAYLLVGRLQAEGVSAILVPNNEKEFSANRFPVLFTMQWVLGPNLCDVMVRPSDLPDAIRIARAVNDGGVSI